MLLRGKLFAGAVFAGALFGATESNEPPAPIVDNGGGGGYGVRYSGGVSRNRYDLEQHKQHKQLQATLEQDSQFEEMLPILLMVLNE